MTVGPIDVSLIPGSEREAIAESWQELERAVDGGIAVSWDWTATWLRHYGDLVPHRFALCRTDGRPCAVALITSSRRGGHGLPAIRVLHLGTAGAPSGRGVFVEWNRLLAMPAVREQAAAALVSRLCRERGWDELALDGFDPEDAQALLSNGLRTTLHRERSPVTDLGTIRAEGRDVLDVLGGGVRRRLRQSLKAFGELEVEWAVAVDQGLEILAELADLHRQRWRPRLGATVFDNPIFVAFHRELIRRLLPSGRAVLLRVKKQASTVGCLYCLAEGGRALFYQGGFARFEDNRLRPGLVTHLLCMRACLERGFDEYDFLVGEARYKSELSTGAREMVWASLRRPRARFAIRAGARVAARVLARHPR